MRRPAPARVRLRDAEGGLAAVAQARGERAAEEERPEQPVRAPPAGGEDDRAGDSARDRSGDAHDPQGAHRARDGRVQRDRDEQRRPRPSGRRREKARRPDQPELVDHERRWKRGDDVVVDPRPDRLEERVDGGADQQDRGRVRASRATRDEDEDGERRRRRHGPVRQQPDPRLLAVPGQGRPADQPAGDRGGRVAERHHGPHRGGDRQVLAREDEDQQQHHRGIGDDAGVAPHARVAVDPAADPRHDERVEEQGRRRERRGGPGVEPPQREREEAHPRVDRLALPLGGGQAGSPAKVEGTLRTTSSGLSARMVMGAPLRSSSSGDQRLDVAGAAAGGGCADAALTYLSYQAT